MKTHPYSVIIPLYNGDEDEMRFWWWDRMSWLGLHARGQHVVYRLDNAIELKPGCSQDPVAIGGRQGSSVMFSFSESDDAVRFKLTFG